MKALSVSQPFASLVILAVKRLETRPWHTDYRGPLVIHASKTFPEAAKMLCQQNPWRAALDDVGVDIWSRLPRGCLVGVVDLVNCVRAEKFGEVPPHEQALGFFAPGQWVWHFANARALRPTPPWRGRLGLFDVPDELITNHRQLTTNH
jgi:activating signal cointegrator 1